MSAEAEAAQDEAQVAQVELEYRREEKRENKAMDAKLVAPKLLEKKGVRILSFYDAL
jgi:hypothetical protein